MDSAGPEEFELNGEVGAVERLPSRWRLGGRPINVNHYANKKSAAESMLDIALLMANASQLKAVIEQGPSFSFFTPLIVLISISLVLQVGVGVLLIFLEQEGAHRPPSSTSPPHPHQSRTEKLTCCRHYIQNRRSKRCRRDGWKQVSLTAPSCLPKMPRNKD
uniref:Ninjurin 1 n=1 Tax=Ornithorhynchus anatinus TaxID=9258 RepID=A0A6I8PBR4_ORNAN